MKLLVFGKSGQVARELDVEAQVTGYDVTCLNRDQADLSKVGACQRAIENYRPDAVINAAAYTDVDRAESEEALARRINGDAPGEIALSCAALGIPLLHISTDYIFDGSGNHAWNPADAPCPVNAYGRTKLQGEQAVLNSSAHSVILRTSWVFSEFGRNFVTSMRDLAGSRNRLSVVSDQFGGPTPARSLARALMQIAAAMNEGHSGGVYHFAGNPAVSRAAFARAIFARSGIPMTVFDIPTSDYPTPARRPLNSRLDCSSLVAEFGIGQPQWEHELQQLCAKLS